jgi:hypothetical protein
MAFVLMIKGLVLTSLLALMIAAVTVTASDDEGYVVETVLDGNKLGLSVYSINADVENGESVVALDVSKSILLRFLLSQGSESMKRIAGSPEGKAGYRDGHAGDALFNHPKNLAVDDDNNIYIADPKNFAIRKLSKTGFVTTIAGGSNKTGHTDGKGQEASFSNDFAVTYVRNCCCLLVADHGNRMVRQIQLPQVDGHCPGVIPKAPRRNILGGKARDSIVSLNLTNA